MFESNGRAPFADPAPATPAPQASDPIGATPFDVASFDASSFDATSFDSWDQPVAEQAPVEQAEVVDELTSIWNARPDAAAGIDPTEDQWARFDTELPESSPDAASADPLPERSPAAADPFADVSPPAPAVAPTQHEWRPEPASAPEPVAAAASPLSAAREQFGGGRPGGLSKRVPGASLAESRRGDATGAPVEEVDRSADGVRSMLSSFQAGRSRGRVAPSSDAAPTADAAPTTDPAAPAAVPTTPISHDGADRVAKDGRSSQ